MADLGPIGMSTGISAHEGECPSSGFSAASCLQSVEALPDFSRFGMAPGSIESGGGGGSGPAAVQVWYG